MVYYALAMSAGSLGGNRYVSFSLSGLVDVPAVVVTYFILDRYCIRASSGCTHRYLHVEECSWAKLYTPLEPNSTGQPLCPEMFRLFIL